MSLSNPTKISSSDLSSDQNVKSTVVGCFNHANEEVKSAASYALGNVALGNLEHYLPFVLQEIETQPKRQYLLLHSLKEVGQVPLFLFVPKKWCAITRECKCLN